MDHSGPKVAAIVAAGPGVGSAVAHRLASEGYAVAVISRRREAMDTLAGEIGSTGGSARGFAADAGDLASPSATLADVAVKAGTSFDPERIAEHYWQLQVEPRTAWRFEHVFQGDGA